MRRPEHRMPLCASRPWFSLVSSWRLLPRSGMDISGYASSLKLFHGVFIWVVVIYAFFMFADIGDVEEDPETCKSRQGVVKIPSVVFVRQHWRLCHGYF